MRGLFFEGFIFGGANLRSGNLRFEIDWASLTVGSKFTVFALFYFLVEGNFASTSPRGLIFGGAMVFCVSGLGGLYLGGAYTWTGLFSEFYVYGIVV